MLVYSFLLKDHMEGKAQGEVHVTLQLTWVATHATADSARSAPPHILAEEEQWVAKFGSTPSPDSPAAVHKERDIMTRDTKPPA